MTRLATDDPAAMDPASHELDLDRVRDAVLRRSHATSGRQVAREVGMTPTGLRNFLAGSVPQRQIWSKLAGWYLQQAPQPGEEAQLRAAALAVLLEPLQPGRREAAAAEILAVLRGASKEVRVAEEA